jgi:hypothetical protein
MGGKRTFKVAPECRGGELRAWRFRWLHIPAEA